MSDSTRPSPPPLPQRIPSNTHALEPNPFEKSFSQPHQPNALTSLAPPTPPRPNSSSSTSTDDPTRRSESETSKPTLPPITAMASPAGTADFSWAFSSAGNIQGSLRAGPLSPAMLAGPQHHYQASTSSHPHNHLPIPHHLHHNAFDPSSLRTGLTPDGNSRSGLTPLIGGPASFPPPSPNTAAFLAMVTHGSAPHNNPGTITPNTLSAIAGIISNDGGVVPIQNNNGSTNNPSNNGVGTATGPTNGNHQPHPLSVSHVPAKIGGPTANGNRSKSPTPPHQYHQQHQPQDYASSAQSAAATAANGLFLLSQAHHELTKREEEMQQQQQQQQREESAKNGRAANGNGVGKNPGGKRKGENDTRGAPTPKKSRAAASRTTSTTNAPSSRRGARKKSLEIYDDSGADEVESDDEMGSTSPTASGERENRSGRPETEEEKRKNFLERNRQAALKCRQRKKAWLTQLQAKVEYLAAENERLQNTTGLMREEITRLSAVVVAHRDCGLGGVSTARSDALVSVAGGGAVEVPSHGNNGTRREREREPLSVATKVGTGAAPPMVQPVGGSSKRGSYGY